MSKKHFESEISRSLTALKFYYYKPIDIMQAGASKVDFFVCWKGLYIAIECKEVKGHSCPPSDFSVGQVQCLSDVYASGGLPVILVNFERKPLHRDTGRTLAWIGNPGQTSLRDNDPTAREVTRLKSGWDLEPVLDSLIPLYKRSTSQPSWSNQRGWI